MNPIETFSKERLATNELPGDSSNAKVLTS